MKNREAFSDVTTVENGGGGGFYGTFEWANASWPSMM